MASLSSVYGDSIGSVAGQIGGLVGDDAESTADNQLNKQRLWGRFQSRTLPDLVNRQASRGVFHSTPSARMQYQAMEDAQDTSSDIDRLWARQRAQLARQRVMAATGSLF